MIEKHIVLEDVDPVIFYGVNNANMQMIKALFPKLRIVARGNVIRAMGDDEVLTAFESYIKQHHCLGEALRQVQFAEGRGHPRHHQGQQATGGEDGRRHRL